MANRGALHAVGVGVSLPGCVIGGVKFSPDSQVSVWRRSTPMSAVINRERPHPTPGPGCSAPVPSAAGQEYLSLSGYQPIETVQAVWCPSHHRVGGRAQSLSRLPPHLHAVPEGRHLQQRDDYELCRKSSKVLEQSHQFLAALHPPAIVVVL
jgi:hypothetical protein